MPDLEAVAASLAETAASLQEYIGIRAWELAEPQILAVKDQAAERAADLEHELAGQQQRSNDLQRELRRQLNAQVKTAERLNGEVKELRAAVRRADELKVWINEDRKGFVFAEDLWAALGACGSTATRYLAARARGDRDEAAHMLAGYEGEPE